MAQLFHFHWWTTKVEEMETFYTSLGFEVRLRIAKSGSETKFLNPPLKWDDFRREDLMFQIIELQKGKTNITIGTGKTEIFDHIGFIVTPGEYESILFKANSLGWRINEHERRTFISTPWKLRIELQRDPGKICDEINMVIKEMEISLPFDINPILMAELLDLAVESDSDNEVTLSNGSWVITLKNNEKLTLNSVSFDSDLSSKKIDPIGTQLIK